MNELIAGIQKTHPDFNMHILEEIVASNNKQRYSFNDDHMLIRANQERSTAVDVELKEVRHQPFYTMGPEKNMCHSSSNPG